MIPKRSGGYVIGLGQTVSQFNWGSNEHTVLAEVDQGKNTRFNDGKCDASGRLWCSKLYVYITLRMNFCYESICYFLSKTCIATCLGTMGNEIVPAQPERQQGTLYSFGKGKKMRKHVENIDISNGLAWTEDSTTMFYIDSLPRKVYGFDFDITEGNISKCNENEIFGMH